MRLGPLGSDVYRWPLHSVLWVVSDQQGLAWRASDADERQLQFFGGGRAVRSLAVFDPVLLGGSAAKNPGANREGQADRGASRSKSGAAGQVDRGLRSGGLQRRAVPLPGGQRSGSGKTP